MIKQSNATSVLLDQLVKAAQSQKIEPQNQAKHFADQILDILKKDEPSLESICRSAMNQAKANKIAQMMDTLPEAPPDDMGGEIDPTADLAGNEMEEDIPVDEAPLDQEPIAGDPSSIINQITDLLNQLKQSVQGETADAVEDLGEAPIDEAGEEPLGEDVGLEEGLGEDMGLEEESAPMAAPAAPMAAPAAPMPMM